MTDAAYAVPAWHHETIAAERAEIEPDGRMLDVVRRMGAQAAPDFSDVDWAAEVARFGPIDFPDYYTQPFHSLPGGYLSALAAAGDRRAMEAIYEASHPRRSLGVRDELAALLPDDVATVVDLGAGTCDGPAAVARRFPDAEVTAIEASPFMLVAGRVQNGDVPNLHLRQGFAERTGLPDAGVDAVTITLVCHECPDAVKRGILREAARILRPGGWLVLSDTPSGELHRYRGFYEPYKEQWRAFDPEAGLAEAGFAGVRAHSVVPDLWSRIARRPA